MKKPVIGVLPLVDEERESLWMLPGYMEGISDAGALPIMLPLTSDEKEIEQLLEMCDGLLFTGGQDVSPEIYNEKRMDNLVCSCSERDAMELIVLKKAMDKNIPILGICRGIQFINAALGGTLYQDLPLQFGNDIDHHMTKPYDKVQHMVEIFDDTPLHDLLKVGKLGVNSYHHQAIKTVAPELVPMAKATDGIVEAVYHPAQKFLWALQWHPEFSFKTDKCSQDIFKAFIKATL